MASSRFGLLAELDSDDDLIGETEDSNSINNLTNNLTIDGSTSQPHFSLAPHVSHVQAKHNNYRRPNPNIHKRYSQNQIPLQINPPLEIKGFVVNVHGATNFDIDMELPPYWTTPVPVISNDYSYLALPENFVYNPGNGNVSAFQTRWSKAYRCHLRGVTVHSLATFDDNLKNAQLTVDVKKLLDRSDNWVSCRITDIDGYKRFLVDITITVPSGETIDMRTFTLQQSGLRTRENQKTVE